MINKDQSIIVSAFVMAIEIMKMAGAPDQTDFKKFQTGVEGTSPDACAEALKFALFKYCKEAGIPPVELKRFMDELDTEVEKEMQHVKIETSNVTKH